MTADEIINIRNILNINKYDKIFYLIGDGISKSPSPKIHNYAFNFYNLNYKYKLFETKNIDDISKILYKINFGGASVTTPFKEKIIPYLDYLSNDAKLIGSVNTIKKTDRLEGYNTDWIALYNIIKKNRVKKSYGCVIGTGGASRAACYAFDKSNIRYDILGRNKIKCLNLKYAFGAKLIDNINNLKKKYNIIIICVPNYVKLNLDKISKNAIILDMSYSEINHRNYYERKVFDGYKILIDQAIKQFEIWNSPKNNLTTVYYDAIK